ncbi:hypothetical protein HZB74_03180 [Candidatus Saccharibacteria bacterium]|nr:hypothetical protein [Candidatus Saccharibacteria bacterium]
MNNSYTLDANNLIFSHGLGLSTSVVKDIEDISRDKLRVCLRSGDYFAMLATILDEISVAVEKSDVAEARKLQKLVEDLLYLQREYKIVQKD